MTAARKRIAHVVVAYDDSAGARVALAQAVALLKVLPDAKLTLIAIDEPEIGNGVIGNEVIGSRTNDGRANDGRANDDYTDNDRADIDRADIDRTDNDRANDDAPAAAGRSRARIPTHSREWIKAANEYAQQHGALVTAADVRTGHAAGQILIAARAAHADLLVIGHGRHPELHNRVLGSTAEHVVRHAFCSVLVAH